MDQAATPTIQPRSPVLVAVASWLVPGMGYWMIGQTTRGLTIGITVVVLFLSGLLIGGIRVLDVPGFDSNGQPIRDRVLDRSVSIMRTNPKQEIVAKPWSMAQVLAGPIAIVSGAGSIMAAQPTVGKSGAIAEVSHTPVNEAGTLYTSVAGMLNLLAIIDAAYRASRREGPDRRDSANAQAAERREVA
jgi:hypothetical protein